MLHCNFKGRPLPSLIWRHNNQTFIGNSSRYIITNEGGLLINDVRLIDAGQYYCSVSNDFGSDTIVTGLYVQGKGEREGGECNEGNGKERRVNLKPMYAVMCKCL